MKTIKEVIEESAALAERLIAETPGLESLSFEFKDFPLDEVEKYAKDNGEDVKFMPTSSRFGFLVLPHSLSCICIHIRSVQVKAKLVYDEVETVTAE